ncbi:FlgD immunoglobulin-like domain containing protein, partial [Candidatus Poribacteria bacterium]
LEKEHMDRCWTNFSLAVFSSDGKQFVAIAENYSEQPETMIWDFETGLPISETEHIGPVIDVGVDFLQAYQVDGTVEVRFLESNGLLSRISDDLPEWGNWEIFWKTRFHPSGNVLAIGYDWASETREGFGFYNVWSGELISTAPNIMDLQFTADGSYMFLVDGSGQLGLYRTSDVIGKPIPSVFAVDPSDKKVTTLGQIKRDQLLQNYPNPLNPDTWIPYRLAGDSKASMTIYDSTGQIVKTLDLGHRKAGYHTTHWDGKDDSGQSLASGVYFCVLKVDDGFSDIKKMALLR